MDAHKMQIKVNRRIAEEEAERKRQEVTFEQLAKKLTNDAIDKMSPELRFPYKYYLPEHHFWQFKRCAQKVTVNLQQKKLRNRNCYCRHLDQIYNHSITNHSQRTSSFGERGNPRAAKLSRRRQAYCRNQQAEVLLLVNMPHTL
jgi:hypothetical protein